MLNTSYTLNIISSFIMGIVLGVIIYSKFGYVENSEIINPPLVDRLIKECQDMPWKYEPPIRPSCKDMSYLKYNELMSKDCIMCSLYNIDIEGNQ